MSGEFANSWDCSSRDRRVSRAAGPPEVCATLAWTRQAVEGRGWRYEVWTEPPPVELANVRFLSGYRRSWLFRQDILDRLSEAQVDGLTTGQTTARHGEVDDLVVRGCLCHLL